MDGKEHINNAQKHRKAVKVTVFTPTYNRRQTLGRAYQSLRKQTLRDFEWVIIDDGSTDGTDVLVSKFQNNNDFFPIIYRWKPNGGKHTAHNLGLSLARGEYFAILDSDDWYASDALMILVSEWNRLEDEVKVQFANIEGLCRYTNGSLAGFKFPRDVYDSDNFEITKIAKRPTETRGMYRLKVLKEFPFPKNYEGSYVPESLIWNRIAEKYRTRFINRTVGYFEYRTDGLTKRSLRHKLSNSKPAILYNWELSRRKGVSRLKRIKCRANVYRYLFHNRLSLKGQVKKERSVIISLLFTLAGCILYLKDWAALVKENNTQKSLRKRAK